MRLILHAMSLLLIGGALLGAGAFNETSALANPFNFTGTAISQTAVKLSWDYQGSNPGGFRLWRAKWEGSEVDPTLMPDIISGSTDTFVDTGLSPASYYDYRIAAFVGLPGAEQSWSEAVGLPNDWIQTLSPVVKPTKFRASEVSSAQVKLTWDYPTNPSGYSDWWFEISRAGGGEGWGSIVADDGYLYKSNGFYIDEDVLPDENYRYAIFAFAIVPSVNPLQATNSHWEVLPGQVKIPDINVVQTLEATKSAVNYGPLSVGATNVLLEGDPAYVPQPPQLSLAMATELKKEGRIYLDANRADNPTLVASTKCGIREETSVDSLPEWPDDSRLLLELHDGKVVCDHLQNAALFDGEILVLNKGRLRFIGTAFTITTRGEQLRIAVAKGTLEFTFFEGVTDDERVATIQAGQVLIFVPELELRRWHLLPAAFPVEDSNLFAEFGISVQPDTTAPTFGDPPGFTAITWDIARKEPVAGPENTLVVTFSEPIDPYSVSPGDFLIDATVPVFTEWFGEMPNAVFATIRGRVSPKESAIVEMVGEILDLSGTAMRTARAELRPGCELDCVAGSLPPPVVRAGGHELVDRPDVPFRDPLFIEISFEASPRDVAITSIALDGDDLTDQVTTPDDMRFLVAITGIAPGEHKLVVMAEDDVGNKLAEQLEVVFTVGARESFAIELIPGWNFLSIPVDPANPSINAVFADMAGVSVVVTYDPSIPGRFLTAVRGADGNFAGTLRTVQSARAYWVQTDAFETVQLGVPVLAVPGAQPLALPIVEGWNLVPVLDITGMKGAGETILARDYFASAEHITTVFSFDTRANEWKVVSISPNSTATVEVGRAYWVFSATASNLVLAP